MTADDKTAVAILSALLSAVITVWPIGYLVHIIPSGVWYVLPAVLTIICLAIVLWLALFGVFIAIAGKLIGEEF